MENINSKIDEIILKYQLDKYYPAFREERKGEKERFANFIPWESSYYDYIDRESIDILKYQNLMDRLDITVLESIRCMCELANELEMKRKKEYLERLFFLAIYKRNFILAEEVFQQLQQDLEDEWECRKAWEEICTLIKFVKGELRKRKIQDTIGIWLDAVSYKNIKEISYLEELMQADHTVSFSNAYTMTPYTNPTFALMLTGKKRIDDQSYLIERIDDSNSEILELLKNRGYSCKFLGAYWKQIDDLFRGDVNHYVYAPCSEMLWDMICHLLDSQIPTFTMVHIFSEPHFPYFSMNQRTIFDCKKDMRRLRGRQEIDRQLKYYMEFLGTNTTRLFFSDHGDDGFSKDVFHTVLAIHGQSLKKENIEEIFSYEKFSNLLKQIVFDKRINKSVLISDYAEIQEIPLYNKDKIKRSIVEKKQLGSQNIWGYRGIIDSNYIYLYHGESNDMVRESLIENGTEDYFGSMFVPGYYHICNEKLVSHYREIVRKKPMAYMEDEKFKYSRYIRKAADNAMPKQIHKRNLLKKLFLSLPDHGIAFRGGGLDTGRILTFYKKELQGVEYIVDQNKNCQCSKLNLPIISVEEIEKQPIHTVLLSSKKFIKEFRKESMNYPADIQVIDVYQYLEDNGIIEKYPFYYFQPDDEDYDVGFPFDE
ncbi:hypothetical protein C818_02122 [Lachnospiraceae bacterium MD308]|nr:hypothetical protein C818_02122 [Lachnospiraceae bacterium MD308]